MQTLRPQAKHAAEMVKPTLWLLCVRALHVRALHVRVLICAGIVGVSCTLVGCQGQAPASGSKETESIAEPEASQATAAPEQEQAAALQTAGAEVTSDDQQLIKELAWRETPITDEIAKQVAKLAAVSKLTIYASEMSDAGWASLGQLTTIQQLDLRECPLTNEQLHAAIAGSQSALRAIRLSGKSGATTVDDAGLGKLAECRQLKALALDHLWVGADGLAALANEQSNITELYLAGTLIDDQGMETVAKFPKLRKLRIAQTSVGQPGLQQLAKLPIEDLDISECSQVADDAMASVGSLSKLKRLNLWRDGITDEGVAQLAGLKSMQWLNLDNTQLSDSGLVHLKNMQELTFLHLGSTSVSDSGMPELKGLKALRDLKVTRTAVTEEGSKLIAEAIPGLDVQINYLEGQ